MLRATAPGFDPSTFRVTKKLLIRVMKYQEPWLPSVEIWTPIPACDGETTDRYDYYVSNPNRFADEEEAFAAFAAAEIFNGELPGKEK